MNKVLMLALACTSCLTACHKKSTEAAMKQAGDNRHELEAVLEHYRKEPLKKRAARFLIENMDAHFAFGGEAVEAYGRSMDSLFRHGQGDRGYWNMQYDSLLQHIGVELELCQNNRLHDTETLTADFLIEQRGQYCGRYLQRHCQGGTGHCYTCQNRNGRTGKGKSMFRCPHQDAGTNVGKPQQKNSQIPPQ